MVSFSSNLWLRAFCDAGHLLITCAYVFFAWPHRWHVASSCWFWFFVVLQYHAGYKMSHCLLLGCFLQTWVIFRSKTVDNELRYIHSRRTRSGIAYCFLIFLSPNSITPTFMKLPRGKSHGHKAWKSWTQMVTNCEIMKFPWKSPSQISKVTDTNNLFMSICLRQS